MDKFPFLDGGLKPKPIDIDKINTESSSLLVHGMAMVKEDGRSYPYSALLDCSCDLTAIDWGYVKQHNLPIRKLEEPLMPYLADGRPALSGIITEYVELMICIRNHLESI
jgi:hypothetical protein